MSNNKNSNNRDLINAAMAQQAESVKKLLQSTKESRAVAESIGRAISKQQQEMAEWVNPAMQNLKDAIAPIENIGKAISKQQQEIATLIAPVTQQITYVQQALQPAVSAITPIVDMVSTWHEMFKPLQETISFLNTECFSALRSIENNFRRPLMAIEILGKNQYVHWRPLTDKQISNIIEAENIDVVLYDIETANDNEKLNNTITDSINCKQLQNHQRIFEQAIEAHHRGDYDIAIVAMLTIIDGLLTKYSGNIKTGMKERMEQIIKNIDSGVAIKDDDLSELILSMTFCSTIEALSESVPFSKDEPINLNRHWIIHGRTTRDFTSLDCIKLINCIYGILLIGVLQGKETKI